jgi:hypothetical protein
MNYIAIKLDLENECCSEHGRHPKVTIQGDKISFNCCCESFGEICKTRLRNLLIFYGKKSITDTLNRTFKKL